MTHVSVNPLGVQYASDLHLDHFPITTSFSTFLTPAAPILILAGDVASAWSQVYIEFLYWCSDQWKHVILITGNHEYFCDKNMPHSRKETDAHIQKMCCFLPNVHFLQGGQSYIIPNTNLVFIGATLYSDIDPAIHDEILVKGDFRKTYTEANDKLKLTTPRDLIAIHKRHRQAVADAIRAVPRDYKIVVVTHYLPTERLLEPIYQGEAWRSCYASKLDYLIRLPVNVWICGHGHRGTHLKTKNGVLLAMNARGYNKRNELERKVDLYHPNVGFIL